MKILIVAPAWVGDMVMSHTLVQLLHQTHPDVSIHMLAPAATLPIADRMPGVSDCTLFDFAHGQLDLAKRWRCGRSLSDQGFDQAIVLPNSFKSAITPWAAGIPKRTGWAGEARVGLLNDRRSLDKERYPLMIERFMALALTPNETLPAPYPEPTLTVDAANQLTVRGKLGLASTRPVLVLCPGAEFGPAKQWPARHFASVAQQAIEQGWQVWLVGSPGDQNVCTKISEGVIGPLFNLAGATSLTDAVDLLGAADRVVCNDSGLMHVACGLKRPVVAVYGSTSPGFTPPLSTAATILRLGLDCSPCFERTCPLGHLNCLNDLAPARVIDALALDAA